MLKHLQIRDFAIIDTLALDFAAGFTVLTGETGAGKSILIDAIGLLLGDRADSAMVRGGCTQAELAAEFSLASAPAARAWLEAQALTDPDAADSVLLRRVIASEGRTRAFINGSAVPLGSLRELGEHLIEIHGQHEHQTLLRAENQRRLLDDYGDYAALLDTVAEAARRCLAIDQAIETARGAARQDPARLDYLRHQIHELEALALGDNELETIDAEHRQLANAGRLIADGSQALEALYGSDDAIDERLSAIRHLLDSLSEMHADFREAGELVASAQIQVQEAGQILQRLTERIDVDPERLAAVERRLSAIHDLARKHRTRPEQLPALLAQLQDELRQTEDAASQLDRLSAERATAERAYRKAADELTLARIKTAKRLAKAVAELARELGMAQARLEIEVGSRGQSKPSIHGDDEIRFDFSANPGQPPRPLAKVASGGELSRVSLAIQVVASQSVSAATMIFDEVDAGVGGATAQIVGARLRALAARGQVLCVTHLPQVAAQGQQHFSIRKEVAKGQTYTRVLPLDDAQRVEELSRMLGGVEVTEATRGNARELLARAAG